jgi:hypothetical protein
MSRIKVTAILCDSCGARHDEGSDRYFTVKVDGGEASGSYDLCTKHTNAIAKVLGVGDEKPRPSTKRGMKPWTEDEIQKVKDGMELGLKGSEIAREIGRSNASVYSKIADLREVVISK